MKISYSTVSFEKNSKFQNAVQNFYLRFQKYPKIPGFGVKNPTCTKINTIFGLSIHFYHTIEFCIIFVVKVQKYPNKPKFGF